MEKPPINEKQYQALKKRYPGLPEEEYAALYEKMQQGTLTNQEKVELEKRYPGIGEQITQMATAGKEGLTKLAAAGKEGLNQLFVPDAPTGGTPPAVQAKPTVQLPKDQSLFLTDKHQQGLKTAADNTVAVGKQVGNAIGNAASVVAEGAGTVGNALFMNPEPGKPAVTSRPFFAEDGKPRPASTAAADFVKTITQPFNAPAVVAQKAPYQPPVQGTQTAPALAGNGQPNAAQPSANVNVPKTSQADTKAPATAAPAAAKAKPEFSPLIQGKAIAADRSFGDLKTMVAPAPTGANMSVSETPFTPGSPGGALDKSSKFGKPSVAGMANLAMGAASLIGGLTVKKPELKSQDYVASIRPAQGDQRGLQDNLSGINAGVRDVARNARAHYGNNASGYAQAMLAGQANAQAARQQAYGQNSQLLRADQQRVEDGVNRARLFNTQNANHQNAMRFQQDTANYNAVQDASRQATQGAINYVASAEANKYNNNVALKQANQRLDMMGEAQRYDQEKTYRTNGDSEEVVAGKMAGWKNPFEQYKVSVNKKGGKVKPALIKKKK